MLAKPLHKTIQIDAPVSKVWSVFMDPSVTKLMGDSYVTDWKPGSSLGWRANSGQMYTNGKVLRIIDQQLIEHSLIDMYDSTKVIAVICYTFKEESGGTLLEAIETPQVHWSQKQYAEASSGWDSALRQVRDIAERI